MARPRRAASAGSVATPSLASTTRREISRQTEVTHAVQADDDGRARPARRGAQGARRLGHRTGRDLKGQRHRRAINAAEDHEQHEGRPGDPGRDDARLRLHVAGAQRRARRQGPEEDERGIHHERPRARGQGRQARQGDVQGRRCRTMSGSLNRVELIGNLGRDPEVRHLNDGSPVVKFSVATSDSWTDKGTGERRDRTQWHNVVVYGEGLCKVAQQYLKKGHKVYVAGSVETRKYTDQGNVERSITEVILRQIGRAHV